MSRTEILWYLDMCLVVNTSRQRGIFSSCLASKCALASPCESHHFALRRDFWGLSFIAHN